MSDRLISILAFSLSSFKECPSKPTSVQVENKEVVCEVLQLISNLNNPVKVSHLCRVIFSRPLSYMIQAKLSETSLLKLQRKFPELFQDLCLYCDVSVLLGEFQFRLSSRKFIQELFVEVNLEQVRG